MSKWARKEDVLKFIYAVKKHMPITIYDTETTGLKSTDYIIQFSGMRLEWNDDENWYAPTEIIDEYIKPPLYMSQEVINIHGITNEFLSDKPTEEKVFEKIYNFMTFPSIITGYNVRFDNRMFSSMCERNGKTFEAKHVVDVFKMVKEMCIRNEKSKNRRLSDIAEELGVNDGVNFHSALDDIQVTWKVGLCLANIYIASCQKIVALEKGTVTKISYYNKGRYIDRLYVDVKTNTRLWKIYYDLYNSYWCDVDDNDSALNVLDMLDIEEQMDNIAETYFKKDNYNLIRENWVYKMAPLGGTDAKLTFG